MHIGIDLGSRAIKLAAIKNGELVSSEVVNGRFKFKVHHMS